MRRRAGFGLALALVVAAVGCGPRETAEDRITRLRLQYEIQPDGFQPRVGADGAPEIILSLLVVNTGRERLDALTVLLRVQAPDGSERAQRRVPIDVSTLRPGVSGQLSAIVPAVEFHEGDQVLIEREASPPATERHSYPEFAGAL